MDLFTGNSSKNGKYVNYSNVTRLRQAIPSLYVKKYFHLIHSLNFNYKQTQNIPHCGSLKKFKM